MDYLKKKIANALADVTNVEARQAAAELLEECFGPSGVSTDPIDSKVDSQFADQYKAKLHEIEASIAEDYKTRMGEEICKEDLFTAVELLDAAEKAEAASPATPEQIAAALEAAQEQEVESPSVTEETTEHEQEQPADESDETQTPSAEQVPEEVAVEQLTEEQPTDMGIVAKHHTSPTLALIQSSAADLLGTQQTAELAQKVLDKAAETLKGLALEVEKASGVFGQIGQSAAAEFSELPAEKEG